MKFLQNFCFRKNQKLIFVQTLFPRAAWTSAGKTITVEYSKNYNCQEQHGIVLVE